MKFGIRLARLLPAGLLSLVALPALAAQAPMMPMPSVSIVSPAAGATVSSENIPVTLAVKNFTVECADTGKTNTAPMQGHIHAMLDGMAMSHLVGMSCSKHFTISGQGLKPGKHMLAVVLADDAHAMDSAPAMASFNYEPASQPAPLPQALTGKPSVSILSPANGAAVGKTFDVKLAVRNFDLSCDLEGKPDIAGYGHVHIFVTQNGETSEKAMPPMATVLGSPSGKQMAQMLMKETGLSMPELKDMAMMTIPGMLSMPCTKTIPVDLSAWKSGPAKIMVMLANNDHMPTMGIAPAAVNVTLK